MADLTILVNTGTEDIEYGGSGAEFTEVDTDNDYLIFTNGSDVVADGEAIPSTTELNQAGVIIQSTEVIVPKYILADIGSSILREIHLAGNQNKRYVFCFSFDGTTSSEPTLEVWDDSNLNTIAGYSLGAGVADDSWFRGVVTTYGLPGADWTGIKLAGSADGYFLWLNNENGALSSAKDLYCNLKVVVPANASFSGAENPVIAIKFTTN